ncbi:MAG: hypothetical protein HY040_17455 [Planctomycetes bacterium]|nr:hypothetical protein [Planctomycetota bacterium]
MDLLCPHCQKKLDIPETVAGQTVRCPHCAASFTAPGLAPIFPEGSIRADMAPMMPPLLPPDLALEGEGEPPVLEISQEPSVRAPKPGLSQAGTTGGYDLVQESIHVPAAPKPPAVTAEPKPPQPAPPSAPTTTAPPPPPVAEPIGEGAAAPVQSGVHEVGAATKPPSKSEYDHGFTLYCRRDVLAWVAPVGLTLLFFLSFFHWESTPASGSGAAAIAASAASLWQMAFSRPSALFIFYLLLVLVAWPLSIAAFLLQKKLLATPPALKGILPWSSLILTVLTLLAFLLFVVHYFQNNFYAAVNPSTVAMKLAIRIHFLVVLGALTHFWLVRRGAKKMPEPRITIRW